MRAIWKGAISFGLVNIPVRLYAATERETPDFHLLYKKDMSQIRYKRVAESTGKEVPSDQIVKGYKLEDNQFVIITDEELEQASPEKSTNIDIQEFVAESEISSLYFDKPYYLEPDKGAAKPYVLLRDALLKSGKVGISQFVLRNREHLCALKAQGNVLVLNALRFAAEIRDAGELIIPTDQKVNSNEVALAVRLIGELTSQFDPKKFKDTYTEDVRKLIEAKAKGKKVKAPAAKAQPSEKVVDLMSALQESLKSTKKKAA
ncbi:MAG: Ku protein [Verrucomicrobia bacterium]|nr:Ku protein [Verrucomicrobiota bacterium]